MTRPLRRTVLAMAALVAGATLADAQTRPTPQAARPAPTAPAPDAAFAAYQRGQFLTAFREATARVEAGPDTAAMVLLGELLASGFGVPQSDVRAVGWYRLAAERGDRNGMFALAMFHAEGRGGLSRDPLRAKDFFERAAALGHAAAAYNLGVMALSGQGGPVDRQGAARWFAQAAELGNADAQYAFGVMLKDGDGVAADLPRARRLVQAAAEQSLVEAQIELGIMLFNGQGGPADEAAAAQSFRRAALRGNPVAMNRYARLLAAGRGVAANPVEAARWHLVARLSGADDDWLRDFVSRLDSVQREAAESGARDWLR